MKSGHVIHLLSEFLDGQLDNTQAERVKSHLLFCNACRNHLSDLEKNTEILKTTPVVEPPADLAGRVFEKSQAALAEVPKEPEASSGPNMGWFFSVKGLALAASCLIAGLAIWNINDSVFQSSKKLGETQLQTQQKQSDRAPQMKGFPAEEGLMEEKEVGSNKSPTYRVEKRKSVIADSDEMKKSEVRRGNANAMAGSGTKMQFASRGDSNEDKTPMDLERRTGAKKSAPYSRASAPLVAAPTKVVEEPLSSISRPSDHFTEYQGAHSNITTSLNRVVRGPNLWAKLWAQHTGDKKTAPPAIDFQEYQLLVIFHGQTGTAVTLKIDQVAPTTWDGNPARIVKYKVLPASNNARNTVDYQPFLITKVPSSPGRVFFKRIP